MYSFDVDEYFLIHFLVHNLIIGIQWVCLLNCQNILARIRALVRYLSNN